MDNLSITDTTQVSTTATVYKLISIKSTSLLVPKQGGVTSMPPVVPFAFTIKILDQEITDNCRRAQIYNDIHVITEIYRHIRRKWPF